MRAMTIGLSLIFLSTNLMAGKSPRALHSDPTAKKDLATAPMPSVPVGPVSALPAGTGTSARRGFGASSYLASDVTNQGLVYPPPPADNSSLPLLAAAIQAFAVFMKNVDLSNNAPKYKDWENPALTGQGSAPPLPDDAPSVTTPGGRAPELPNTSTPLDSNCGKLPKEALDRMKAYLKRCGRNVRPASGNVAITDFSTDEPVVYVLKRSDLSCAGSSRVSFGIGSHGKPPTPGNTPGGNATPAGFMTTKAHHGEAYQEWNSIGLRGLGSENNNTEGRGVIMHPSRGHTLGCIGIPFSRFATFKVKLGYGSVVYNYFPGFNGGNSERYCPAPSGSGAVPAGQNTEDTGNDGDPTGATQ